MKILQETVDRSFNRKDNFGIVDLAHGVIGLSGEAGELCDALKRHLYYDQELDRENIIEEIGDCLFYLEVIARCIGTTLADSAEHNAEKLRERYPDGFTPEHAVKRMDKNDCCNGNY